MATTIRVPTPCTESWEAMPSTEGGRSCAICDHVVPDLTRASDAELAELVARNALPKCARFRADQLERVLTPPTYDPLHALQLTVMSSMLLLPAVVDAKKGPAAVAPLPLPLTSSKPVQPPEFIFGDVIPFVKERAVNWFFPVDNPSCGEVVGITSSGPAERPLSMLAEVSGTLHPAPVEDHERKPDPAPAVGHPALVAVFFRRSTIVRGWSLLRRPFFKND